jgi:hypothetical protein
MFCAEIISTLSEVSFFKSKNQRSKRLIFEGKVKFYNKKKVTNFTTFFGRKKSGTLFFFQKCINLVFIIVYKGFRKMS